MKLTLIEKKKLTPEVFSFVFKTEEKIKWKAGQYLIYTLPHKNMDLRGKMRFFTISASPFQKFPSISTKIVKESSSFKKALNKLKIGDEISAKGPDGDFVIKNPNKKYVFIAGGIGITPFASIIRQLNFEKKKINVTLLYSGKTNDLPFKKDFEQIGKSHKEFKIEYFIGERIDEKMLSKFIKGKYVFFVSGPDPMVEEMEKLLFKLGIKKENFKDDYFSGYKSI